MKAFVIDRYKPSDGGRIADVPEPVPTDGQVLVQIHAAGVNVLDSTNEPMSVPALADIGVRRISASSTKLLVPRSRISRAARSAHPEASSAPGKRRARLA